MPKPFSASPPHFPPGPTPRVSGPPTGQMARFTMRNGMTLDIHIPDATAVETSPSPARTAGFILQRGREIVNVGVLSLIFRE